MADIFDSAPKNVLVQIVKLAQKRGIEGDKGGWKDFLNKYDTKFGASMSDPTRRTLEDLLAFLHTLKNEEDLECLAKVLKCHSNVELVKSQDDESPEQKLVRLTLEHPEYSVEYSFPSHKEDWIITKLRKRSKMTRSSTLLAVDCEMVLCEDGTEALVKICVVDRNLQVKLHEFVNPNKRVADYRTQITGVTAEDLNGVACSLADIQKSLMKLFSRGVILVGHGLSNDLKALKIDHTRVIDTSFIFKCGNESTKRRPSLNDLCESVLGYELRKKGAPHNCVDDACAAMKLVVSKIEKGIDVALPVVQDDVQNGGRAKLFIHRIPKDLPSEELHLFIPGDFTIEVQTSRKGRGDKYCAFATFGSSEDAVDAYENLPGDEAKDSSGRPQKPVSIQHKSGSTDIVYVRKIFCDDPPAQVSAKRSYPAEVVANECKKLKTELTCGVSQENPCVDHVKEIEKLNKWLNQRDQEISNLHKVIAALTRKQGL